MSVVAVNNNPVSITCINKTNNKPMKLLGREDISSHKGNKFLTPDLGLKALNSNLAEDYNRNFFD